MDAAYWPFADPAGQMGCCLLDRAIGAMELMTNVHTCKTEYNYHQDNVQGVKIGGVMFHELRAEM